MKTLITAEKSLIMSLPLASPFFSYVASFLSSFPSSSRRSTFTTTSLCLSLAFFRDANHVKYSHDTRMLLQDHGLMVVPVDDSLNYSQRFPLCFHLRGLPLLLFKMNYQNIYEYSYLQTKTKDTEDR